MDLRILVVDAQVFFPIHLAAVILPVFHRPFSRRVDLPDKVEGRLAFQYPRRVIAGIRLTEEVFVVFAGDHAPVGVGNDRLVNALKGIRLIRRVVTDLQDSRDLVFAKAARFLLHIVLQRGRNDGRAHGVAHKAYLLRVYAREVVTRVLDQIADVGHAVCGVEEAAGR